MLNNSPEKLIKESKGNDLGIDHPEQMTDMRFILVIINNIRDSEFDIHCSAFLYV